MAINPNWPTVEHAYGARWGANGGTVPTTVYADVTARTRGSLAIQRGRQYELDQVQSATLTATLANTDGSLDPANAAGPWYGHVAPYQPIRSRAQWPATVNLLTQVQATGGDAGGFTVGAIPASAAVSSDTDGSGGAIAASGTAWQGSNVLQFSVPNATPSGQRVCYTAQPAAERGTTYTVQLRVRNVTASTSLQVAPYVAWWAADGTRTVVTGTTATLTGSASAFWTQLTLTATAPNTAAGMEVGVATAATAAATCSVQVDGWQLEKASSASSWTAPGTWYPLYAGFNERWPQTWSMSGTYGTVEVSCNDAFSFLSQVSLDDPFPQTLSILGPRFVYPLNDPAGSATFAEASGAFPPAPVVNSKYGAGTLTAGVDITAATVPAGLFTGAPGPVVTISNPNPGTGLTSAATEISLDQAGIAGPGSASWTRVIAFRYTGPIPTDGTAGAWLWSAMDAQRGTSGPSGAYCHLSIGLSGYLIASIEGPSGAFTTLNTNMQVTDSNWHLACFGVDATAGNLVINLDGTTYTKPITAGSQPTGIVKDTVGGYLEPTGNTVRNYQGDMAYACEIPRALTSTEYTTLYTAWRSSWQGESTGARYAHILAAAGYTGPTDLDTGVTTSMGPAQTGGQDALSALQAVVDTENGDHYVARDGTLTFRARSRRYNALVPAYVLGERADLGEIPYEDVSFDFDPTHVANDAEVTQASTGQVFSARDAASIAAYQRRTITRTVNSTSAAECQDAAGYLVSRYRQPAVRVNQVTLHPSANPAVLWPACLGLEQGTRIRVMRRPPAAPQIQVDCFVEGIAWTMDDTGEAHVTIQCSPADLTPYGVFAAWHTTLSAGIAAGATTITVNASSDNTNPLGSQLAQGQQLVVGLGTANQETVTVQSVGATTTGWTTATITLTAATTKAHAAGDTVCEPLPAGVTNPAAYDSSAVFDAVNFAY